MGAAVIQSHLGDGLYLATPVMYRERAESILQAIDEKIDRLKGDQKRIQESVEFNVSHLLSLHNAIRAANGLQPLLPSTILTIAADGHADYMAFTGYIGHTGRNGSTAKQRAVDAGYPADWGVGENVAGGNTPDMQTQTGVMDGWMNSPGHRANILNPDYTHIGIAGSAGRSDSKYWTESADIFYYCVKFGIQTPGAEGNDA